MLLMSDLADIGSGRVAVVVGAIGAGGAVGVGSSGGSVSLGIVGPPMFGIRGSSVRISCTMLSSAVRNCTNDT
jgi:hypothetical protein